MRVKLVLVALLLLICVGASAVLAFGSNIERVSVSSDGTQGNNVSDFSSISYNGRYVAFESWASNLVPNDTNGNFDIFVRDRQLNTITRVSIAYDGSQGNGGSQEPSISGDGRYVAFMSTSNNLIPNDLNKTNDIFCRDRQTNTTTLISISDNGTQGNSGSNDPSISNDGRYVAFTSVASNLVPDCPIGCVFIRDRQTNTTTLVSVSDNGTPANGGCFEPEISDDGRYVAFLSYADNLVPDDTNGEGDIFVRDRQSNSTIRVNVASDGTQANLSSGYLSMSNDGRYVTFCSFANNLIPNDTNGQPDVFMHDRQTNTTIRVSIASNGAQNYNGSFETSISDDGHYVTFKAYDGNLVPGETNAYQDIFIHDCQTGATARVSVSDNGIQGNGDSLYPQISGDGHFITFFSDASNLVPNDTNGVRDVFSAENPLPLAKTYTNDVYCFSVQYPGDWVERPDLVTTPYHLAAFGVSAFVPDMVVAALDADAPMSEEWILQSFIDMKYQSPNIVSALTQETLADGTQATTYKVEYVSGAGYDVVAFCLDANRCDKRIRVMVFTIDAFSPYDETLFSEIAHTLTFTCICEQLPGGNIERVSVSDNGTQGNNRSLIPSISNDGRYVTFASMASNLVPNDTNNADDVFVYDRQTNNIVRVSVASNGTEANNVSEEPQISGDGRYIAFYSLASNLVPNDTNNHRDVFIHDRQMHTTTRVSVATGGTQGNDESSRTCISDNGRYVAFRSLASNLVANDTNSQEDIFVGDLQTNITTLISVSDNGTQGNGDSYNPSISGDGRYVTFESKAYNLVPNDTNGMQDIFIRDRQTNTTILISVSDNGTQGNGGSEQNFISYDGNYVCFSSVANNLVPTDTNGMEDVFIRNRLTNTTSRLSTSSTGAQGNSNSGTLSISDDDRYIVFASWGSNLVSNDTNSTSDVFIHDLQTNRTMAASVSDNGARGNGRSEFPSLNSDGKYIAFYSDASNLVLNDTNGATDVFVATNPLYVQLLTTVTAASVASATGTGTINISTNNGSIQTLTAASLSELPYNGRPDNVSFPYGLLSFTITSIPPGSTVTITITYPAPIPQGVQYWKCQNGTWINCTSLIGDDDGDEVLTLTITDGGLGDSDGQVNGQITDPGGPVISVPAPASAPHVSPALPRDLNQTQISLQYLSVNPQQAQVNQPLTIMGNVVNTGNQAGNYNLILKINGRVEQTRMVSVGPQGTQPVKFTITKAQPGTYAVDLGGQTGSFIIIGAAHNDSPSSKGGLLAILIICVMILATIVILLTSRRTA